MTTHRQFNSCEILHIPRAKATSVQELLAAIQASRIEALNAAASDNADAGGRWLRHRRGGSDVLHCSWTKDTTNPAGVLMVTLKPNRANNYLATIRPGDLLIPYMGNGKTSTLITVVIVDRVFESSTLGEHGAPVKNVSVSARDMGKVLQETKLVFDPAFTDIEQSWMDYTFFKLFTDRKAMAPCEYVMSFMDIFYNMQATGSRMVQSQWRMPGDLSFSLMSLIDMQSYVQAPMFGYALPESVQLAAFDNVWTLCQSYTNGVVNEFYIDVRENTPEEELFMHHLESTASAFVATNDILVQKMRRDSIAAAIRGLAPEAPDPEPGGLSIALIHRQLPYDATAFEMLPEHVLNETETLTADIGVASHEVFNFFRLTTPVMEAVIQEVNYGIVVNEPSVINFGLHRLEAETRFCFADSQASLAADQGIGNDRGGFTQIYDYYVGLLSTWHVANENMHGGTIVCRFRPDIRVGRRLVYIRTNAAGEREVLEFYITGVAHQFSIDAGSSRTMLTVVRGINRTEAARDPVRHVESRASWTVNGQGAEVSSYYTRFTALGQIIGDPPQGVDVQSDQVDAGPETMTLEDSDE